LPSILVISNNPFSEFGKIELSDGSQAIVKGHFGEIKNFCLLSLLGDVSRVEEFNVVVFQTKQSDIKNAFSLLKG